MKKVKTKYSDTELALYLGRIHLEHQQQLPVVLS
jgi:hypothetical protein